MDPAPSRGMTAMGPGAAAWIPCPRAHPGVPGIPPPLQRVLVAHVAVDVHTLVEHSDDQNVAVGDVVEDDVPLVLM
jgi:hypothetical protein